jgi:hypothetical protein
MERTMVQGRIKGLGKFYSNGLEQLEITIDKRNAKGLPFVEGQDVLIELGIAERVLEGKLKATKNHSDAWISQSVTENGKRTTLADIFRELGLSKNQKVSLALTGNRVDIALR